MTYLETQRLNLRTVEQADAAVIYDYRNNALCSKYQRGQIKDYAGIVALVEKRKQDVLGVEHPFFVAVALKDTNEMVGEIVVMPEDGTISLGYTFSYRHHRKGYAFESLSALTALLHERYPDWDFVSFTEPENRPSQNLLKKLGYSDLGYIPAMESQAYGKWLHPATEAELAGAAMHCREMTLADLESAAELYIAYYNGKEDGIWTEATTSRRIRQVLTREDSFSLVAEAEGELVAFAMGYFEQFDDGQVYDLVEIVVAAPWQGKGIGTALMQELEAQVKARGGIVMLLDAVNDDFHEHFYGKLGFQTATNLVIKTKVLVSDTGGMTMSDIHLSPMTDGLFHEYYRDYENDSDLYMDMAAFAPFEYTPEWVENYIRRKKAKKQLVFAVMENDRPVGEVLLKNIDYDKGECTLGICLQNHSVKGRGIGTRAEQLILDYATNQLGMKTVYADAIRKNTRSQHVLEKVGFVQIREDDTFKYYQFRCR